MALFTTTVESAAGGNSTFIGKPGRKLFNTARMSEVSPFAEDDSFFTYALEWDGDVQSQIAICNDEVSTILGKFDDEYTAGAISLTAYPFGDLTQSRTEYLDPKIILFGSEFTDYTKLTLSHSREMWVEETVDEILIKAMEDISTVEWSDGIDTFRLRVDGGELKLEQLVGAAWVIVWVKSV
jgi:hypothetical protein